MRTWRLALAIVITALLAACGGDDDTTRVIVDSDGAFDDMKAIVYLLEQPRIEIVAITFSGTGIAHCPDAALNTSALLERLDAPDIPVACGRTTPLAGDNQAPPMWRSAADTLGGVELPAPRPLSDVAAPDLLAETIDQHPDVVVVALGPLTNLAEAIQENSAALDDVAMMYLMGGAVDAGGNVLDSPDAEFNIWADPLAAQIVFETEMPITLVPLDATNDVPVTPYLYDAVAAYRNHSAVSQFMAEYLDVSPLFGGMYHWDELAAVVATDEAVVAIEDRMILIGDGGATLDDPAGRPTRVATSADRTAFEDHFYSAIVGTSQPDVPAWEPDAVLTWDGTTCTYEGPDPLPDNFFIRLDNGGDDFIAFLTGVYNAGTTLAEFEAAIAAAEPGTPDWWLPGPQVFAPTGAKDVWPMRGDEAMTALCYAGPGQVWEVAGPRLTE